MKKRTNESLCAFFMQKRELLFFRNQVSFIVHFLVLCHLIVTLVTQNCSSVDLRAVASHLPMLTALSLTANFTNLEFL